MHPSLTIARLIGPVLCVVGIGLLANQATYREMAAQFLAGYPFIYLSGILALVAGLAILNAHHAWTNDWRSVITALGWLITCGGTFRIFAPQFVNYVGTSALTHTYFLTGAGIVVLALGSFITFKGYAA